MLLYDEWEGQKRTLVDVGQDTALGDGDVTQQLVQLLVVADSKLKVAGNDTGLLVVAGSVASQLENLSGEVLEDGSQVDGSTGTDTLGVVALAQETVDTADGERQTSLGGTAVDGENVSVGWKWTDGCIKTTRRAKRVKWDKREVLTTASSWSRWPCRRTCHQSF